MWGVWIRSRLGEGEEGSLRDTAEGRSVGSWIGHLIALGNEGDYIINTFHRERSKHEYSPSSSSCQVRQVKETML